MKIALHICSYNGRNYKKRYIFLKKIVKNYFLIDKKTKIFIHTNKITEKFKIKKVNYIKHNLHNTNPFYLSWKCRELIKKQRNHFDCFIYSEDDILFTKENFNYWLKFKNISIKNDFNLGFFRIEKRNGKMFSTDLTESLKYKISISGVKFVVNNVNNYCAFWIYDKNELKKFIKTKYWKFDWKGKSMYAFYGIREMSAIGWHGKNMKRYKATIIPLFKKKLPTGSFVSHLSNNHAMTNHPVGFGSITKDKILNKNLKDFSTIKKELVISKYFKYIFRKI